jgi:hypothetical protein
MNIEVKLNKINKQVNPMKRNKRTEILAHEELTPLTEHILGAMGKEGAAIRQRLKLFYREKACSQVGLEPPLDGAVCEAVLN